MRLVADALDKVEGLRLAVEDDGLRQVLDEQLLVLLGEAGEGHVLEPQVAHDVERRRELAFAAVDDDEVGEGAPALEGAVVWLRIALALLRRWKRGWGGGGGGAPPPPPHPPPT